jgi:hypothetical protein
MSSIAALCDNFVTFFDNPTFASYGGRTNVLQQDNEVFVMRRVMFVLIAALAVAPAAHAWTWPASGPVLAPFSFDPSNPYAAGQHRGVDIGGAVGDGVRAPAGGAVSFAGTVPGSGKSVTIDTPDGWSVTLTHLGSITAKEGASVAEGDAVGTIGEPDGGTGSPFVQLGIRHTSDPQGYTDPLGLLPGRIAQAAPVVVTDPPPTVPPPPGPTLPDAAPLTPAVASAPVSIDPASAADTNDYPVQAAPLADAPAATPAAPAEVPAPVANATAAAPAPTPTPAAVVPAPAPTPVIAAPRPEPSAAASASAPATPDPARPPDAIERTLAPLVHARPRPALDPRVRHHAPLRHAVQTPPRVAIPVATAPRQTDRRPLELLAAFAAALSLLAAAFMRRGVGRTAARIIDSDALLPDNADLLREQHASHRACLHDLRRRHPRAASEAARRRDVLPHRRRRARDEGRQGGAGARPHAAGLRRLDRRQLARAGAAAERASGLLHQDER